MWRTFNEYFSEQIVNEVRYVLSPDTKGQLEKADGSINPEYFSKNAKDVVFSADKVQTVAGQFGDDYIFTNPNGDKFVVPAKDVKIIGGGQGRAQPVARMRRELEDEPAPVKRRHGIQDAALRTLSDILHAMARVKNYNLVLDPEDVESFISNIQVHPNIKGDVFVDIAGQKEKLTDRDDLSNQGMNIQDYMDRIKDLKTSNLMGLLKQLSPTNIKWRNMFDPTKGFTVVKRSKEMGMEPEPPKPGQEILGGVEDLEREEDPLAQLQRGHKPISGQIPSKDPKTKFEQELQYLRSIWKRGNYQDILQAGIKVKALGANLVKHAMKTGDAQTAFSVQQTLGKISQSFEEDDILAKAKENM